MKLPQFHEASYRNIRFSLPQSRRSVQRAIAQYYAPYANQSQKDDLGLASESLSVQAFVAGNEAYQHAAYLRAALDMGGAGTLVHPNYGELTVYVQSYEEAEDYVDGLFYVQFSMVFLRADESKEVAAVDAVSAMAQQALALQREFAAQSERQTHPSQLPTDIMRKEMADLNAQLQSLYRLAQLPFEFAEGLLLGIGELQDLILSPINMAASIMKMSARLGEAILSQPALMLNKLIKTTAHLKRSFVRLESLANGSTAQQYTLQLQALGSQLADVLLPAAKAPYQSREQAEQQRSELQALTSKLGSKVDYGTFEKLIELEQSFQAVMAQRIQQLPPEQSILTAEPLPVAMHRTAGKALTKPCNPFFPQDSYSYSYTDTAGLSYV